MTTGEQARLFVTAWPPDDVRDALGALERPDEPGVRYTTRAQWHVTLRFLGTVAVDAAVDALGRVDATACEAVLGPAVARMNRDLVVVPVAGLDALAAAVRRATEGLGEPPPPRFAGHLTIARLKRRPACRIAGAPFRARFPVSSIDLVRSELLPTGARYTTVATRALRPGDRRAG